MPDLTKNIRKYAFRISYLTERFFIKKVKSINFVFITFFGASIFLNFPAYTQISTKIEKLSPKIGVVQITTNYILQDRIGFLWIATGDGIYRYDGYTVIHYKNIAGDITSISHNDVRHICEDTLGNIWVVTSGSGGLNKFDPNTEKFTRYRPIPDDSSSISSDEVLGVTRDKSGRIWVFTRNAVNLVSERKTGGRRITTFKRYYNTTNRVGFTYIYQNRDGKILLFADKLYYLDIEKDKILESNITFTSTDISSFGVTSVVEDEHGNLLIASSIIGLFKLIYNSGTGNYILADLDPILANVIPNTNNKCILVTDHRNRIWVGTQSNGLFIYDEKNQYIKNFVNNESDINSLSENTIQSLFIDRSGILWIGTFSQGINKINLNRKKFDHYRSIPGDDNSISGNVISSIHGINPNELWVGSDIGGGVNRLIFQDNKDARVIHYKHDPQNDNSIGSNSVLSLWQRKNGEVWVGTTGNLVSIINPEKAFSKEKPEIKRLTHQGWPFVIFEDSEKIMWVGSWGNGLSRYNNTTGFEHFRNDPQNPNSICDNVVWAITEDYSGNLWIGGHGKGLSILPVHEKKKAHPEFINFRHDANNPHTLSSNTVEVFYQDRNGTMWIGTAGGLDKVIPNVEDSFNQLENGQLNLTSYHMKDGLPNEHVVGIVGGSNDELWLSTLNGISRFNTLEETFVNYDVSDGLQSNEFWHNAYFKDRNGRIYFGTNNGINAFFPDSIHPNPFLPEVAITDIKLFNKSIKINEEINGDIILTKSVNSTNEITLSHKNNVLTIEFAALYFSDPEMNQYAYFLEGFDEVWQYMGPVRTATYTNLNPGKYIFHAKASNNDGLWNENGIELVINIKPQWWQTLIFKIALVIFLVSLVWAIYYLRLNQLRRQRILLARQVMERTKEIEEKNITLEERRLLVEEQAEELRSQAEELSASNKMLLTLNATKDKFFSIIAHDLKNPFNTILGLCKVLILRYDKYDDPKRKKLIQGIDFSAQSIYRLLENLLQWARSQTRNMKYSPQEIKLGEVVDSIKLLVFNELKEKKLDFKINMPPDYTVYTDKNILSTIIRNLVTNAIKFTEKGMIMVKVVDMKKETLVSVIDTGIGIDKDAKDRIFEIDSSKSTTGTQGETGTGLGLIICKDFVEKLGGNIDVKSTLNKGSEFFFTIPKKNAKKN